MSTPIERLQIVRSKSGRFEIRKQTSKQKPRSGANCPTQAPKRPIVNPQSGKAGWALLWLLGIPLPVLLLLYILGVGR